jgi:predicted kinase
VAELVILVGLPAAGKSSLYRERFAATHVLVSKDLMGRRGDKQVHQLALIDEALAAGRSVAVDNVNASVADRAALIEIARRHGVAVSCWLVTTDMGECFRRNRERVGRARVPNVAIAAAAKRWQRPTLGEGFDRLLEVRAEANRFDVAESGAPAPAAEHTLFLLSPASTSGERGAILLDDRRAASAMAQSLRTPEGVPLGEVYSFLSSLYFRGKLAYATGFARPPAGLCPAFVITPGEGLRDPAERIGIDRLRRHDAVRIKLDEPRYLGPLRRDAGALAQLAGERCRIVLLGSVASTRYVEPLLEIFGERLVFPPDFVGRGDMSRGGLLLRCVDEGRELPYAPVAGAVRHGPRPPRLAPRRYRSPREPSMG